MIGKPTAVIYDLDSTLCDTRHRWKLAPQEGNTYTWVDYSGACLDDGLIRGSAARMRMDWAHHEVHIASGRGGESLDKTINWLEENNLRPWYDFLTLRGIGDERSNAQIKIDYINKVEASGVHVILVYEDHPAVGREIMSRLDVPVLGVNPFYEEDDRNAADRMIGLRSDSAGGGL